MWSPAGLRRVRSISTHGVSCHTLGALKAAAAEPCGCGRCHSRGLADDVYDGPLGGGSSRERSAHGAEDIDVIGLTSIIHHCR